MGNIITRIVKDGEMGEVSSSYTYDTLGRTTSVETGAGTENITYDKAGRISTKILPTQGTEKHYSYYDNGLLKSVLTYRNGKLVNTENSEYDLSGNKTLEATNGNIKRYAYDGLHRLKTVTEHNGNQTEYEFDSFGNISKEYTITPGDIKTKYYHYDKANRLLLMYDDKYSAEYTYDAEGNMISKVSDAGGISTSNYVYDGYNRLSEFYSQNTEAQYSYNPEGLRESKTVNGNTTRFLYSDGNIIGEFTGDDYYIYHRGTELIGYTSFSGKNLTYQQNSHGNVTALLDYDGTELKTYSYNAYGKEEAFIPNPEGNQTILYQWKNETDSTYNPFRYCGEYVDAETGLVYLRNRYYDSSIGRFITEDPARDGLNWYVYCGNNPVNYVDPNGCTEYYVNGKFPKFQFDHTFPYDSKAIATDEDRRNWTYWGVMAWGSGFAPWLKDASIAYKHYRDNTGTDMWIDYERAYKEDKIIAMYIDEQIGTMKNAVKYLYDNKWGTTFNITGELFDIPNGASENWQKTIGAHQAFGVGNVTINAKTGIATMNVTFYMEDMYNFNPGMSDIATGAPDDINGRFSELGWAKEFKTYGSISKKVTWQLFKPQKKNENNGGKKR